MICECCEEPVLDLIEMEGILIVETESRTRYEQAHTSLAWLLVIDPAAATQPPSPASDAGNGPRFESWAE